MLEERGLEADPQVCLLPVAVFLKRDSPTVPQAPTSACGSNLPAVAHRAMGKGTRSDRQVLLHLCALLWYLGSNVARGLLSTHWRNQTVTLSPSAPRLCWAGSRFKCQISPCQAQLRMLSKSPLCCQGGTARELSFLCPLAYLGKSFSYNSKLGIPDL